MTLLSHSISTYHDYSQLRDHLLKYIENVNMFGISIWQKKTETKTTAKNAKN